MLVGTFHAARSARPRCRERLADHLNVVVAAVFVAASRHLGTRHLYDILHHPLMSVGGHARQRVDVQIAAGGCTVEEDVLGRLADDGEVRGERLGVGIADTLLGQSPCSPRIAISALLKSCATPLASSPRARIFSICTIWLWAARASESALSALEFYGSQGAQYTVSVANYGTYTFNHWSNGATTRW